MVWFKAVLAGIVGAVLAVVLVALFFAAWMVVMMSGAGSGGIGAVSFGLTPPAVLVVLVGFGIGFGWALRGRAG